MDFAPGSLSSSPTLAAPPAMESKKPNRLRLGFSEFWLPDLDSNQGPAD